MTNGARFTYLDAMSLSEITDIIAALNKIKNERSYSGTPMVLFVDICNDAAESIGLVYYKHSIEEYVFIPDMGQGIDKEELDY